MPNKAPAIISTVLTILLLILLAGVSVFMQMIALNGASERQGTIAMSISLVCQGIGLILTGLFAGWLSNFMINRFNWNKILAVSVVVILSVLIGGVISAIAFFISIPLAGIV